MSYKVTTLITTDKAVANDEKRLSICLRSNGFSFSIVTLDRVLLTFGEAEFDFDQPLGTLTQQLKDFFADNGIVTFGLRQMDLVVLSECFVWMPTQLYDTTRDRQYLHTVGSPDVALGVFHNEVPLLKSHMIFSAPTTVVTAFKVAIPGIDVQCQHSALVNHELLQRSARHPLMLLHVRQGNVDIEAFYGGQLLLSNSYTCPERSELLYRALGVMKQLHLETPDMELTICGEVDRELFGYLQHYFPSVTLHTGGAVTFENPEFQTFPTYRHALLLS